MNSKQKPHQGYDFGELDYTTKRGLAGYNELHNLDFAKIILDKKLTRGTVVDLGCGNGFFLRDLLDLFPHLNVVGIDKKLYEHQLPDFRQHDLRDLSAIPSDFADLVVSSVVTQWVRKNKHRVYEEAARILKPSGYGFIFPYSQPEKTVRTSGRKFQLRDLEKGPVRIKVPQLIMGNLTPEQVKNYSL